MESIVGLGPDLDTETAPTVLDVPAEGAVVLPEGFGLAGADFDRLGADLILTDDDGARVVVRDYFTGNTPDLESGNASIGGDLAARLAGPVAPGQVAQFGADATALGEPIGTVETSGGKVTATRTDGTVVELAVGDPVYQGDVLETAADGGIGIVLADQTTFSMGAEGRMVLDEMIYDPGTSEGSLAVSVLEGVFTFVSGQIAKSDPEAMILETPVATIGIRGTQAGIDLRDGQHLTVVNMEESDGFVGEIVVTTRGGVQILNVMNQGTTVASLELAPGTATIFDIVAIVQAFGGSLGYLPTDRGTGNDYGVEAPASFDEAMLDLENFETAAGGETVPGTGPVDDVIVVTNGLPQTGQPQPVIVTTGLIVNGTAIPAIQTAANGTEGAAGEFPIVPPTSTVVDEDGVLNIGNGNLSAPDAVDDLSVVGGDGGNVIVTGLGNDYIISNGGDDTVNAGSGDDTVVGGSGEGDDVYTGGSGNDTLVYTSTDSGVYVDLFAGKAFSTGVDQIGFDTFSGFENVIGGDGGDTLYGDDGDNELVGGLGDDILNGGNGNDVLSGGAGDDLLKGAENLYGGEGFGGVDSFNGGDGEDTVSYVFAESDLYISLDPSEQYGEGEVPLGQEGEGEGPATGGEAWGDDIGFDTLENIENVIGGYGDDDIQGDANDNRLEGGAGDDYISGGSGNDTLIGDQGKDYLWGDDGDDVLSGGNGNDELRGGAGNDLLTGGNGPDTFTFWEGDGTDTITDFAVQDEILIYTWWDEADISVVLGEGDDSDRIVAEFEDGDTVEIILDGHQGGGYSISEGDYSTTVTISQQEVN